MTSISKCAGDGEGGGQNRESYSAEDVEYYFNYSGILAERGSYDTMENMLEGKLVKCSIPDTSSMTCLQH